MRRIILAAFLLSAELAQATPAPVVLGNTAKDHFQRAVSLYDATRYDAALHEFEMARSLDSKLPALLYDIAMCLEKLERKEEAAKAYKQYLTEDPKAENANGIRERIKALTPAPTSTAPVVVPAPVQEISVQLPPKPSPRRYIVPGVVGGVALAFAATGAGLLGSAASDYHALESSCSPNCERSSWASLPAREHAGEALLGLAAAAAVVDVVLWVRTLRRK